MDAIDYWTEILLDVTSHVSHKAAAALENKSKVLHSAAVVSPPSGDFKG